MSRHIWTTALNELRATHAASPDLRGFCPFPTDVTAQDVPPHHIPPSDLFQAETAWNIRAAGGLCDALHAASSHANWRNGFATAPKLTKTAPQNRS